MNGSQGVLPYKRLIEMCHCMESYCHDWIDYNGVTFSIELLEWAHRFFDFLGSVRHSSSYILRLANIPESVYCR